MKEIRHLYTLLILLLAVGVSAQVMSPSQQRFTLEGRVVEAADYDPIPRVNIEISGKGYTTTNSEGEFRIEAVVGDELIVRSDDFETVYYTIKDRQDITIEVQKAIDVEPSFSKRSRSEFSPDVFNTYIDSARTFLKKDAKQSIEYVTSAMESIRGRRVTSLENATAFRTLGDINLYWQLPDLAISNYKQSLRYDLQSDTQIQLAIAYMRNGNYQESISLYQELLSKKLSNYQRVILYEGLGDTYRATSEFDNSLKNYEQALNVAKMHKISPKITDLNSKIGEVYAQQGKIEQAQGYFSNSLNLSEQENKKRAAEEKNKVADFYNQKRDFSKEIELRQQTIDEIENLSEAEGEEDVNSPLTPQRQNYKIANAYVAQDRYEEAIPFLERSIAEADAKADLVVQKDATRKLSELYRDIGEFDKAAESYERYVNVVDELYIRKEQELSQAARFSKEIALRQNRIASLENERELNESRYKLAFENQELIEKNNRIQQWIIASLVVIALLLLFVAYTQRKHVRQQKFANNLLALKSLRTQMNPHFIFNALNSVNSFISNNDERAANKYLSEFSQLMRSVLENSEEDFIPLSKEIELLELYVKLEHFRFKDKFEYEIQVDPSIEVTDFVIPPMLLQPYVENAVWHGLRYKDSKGKLGIRFGQKDSETVLITIEDDGIGRTKSKELKTEHQKKQRSKGMGNIKKRIQILNEMYQDKVDVFIMDAMENGEGTRVQLILKKD